MGLMANLAASATSLPLVWPYPSEPATVPDVRHRLRALLVDLNHPQMDDVLLATNELVTNAILHGEGTLTVTVWLGDGLRVVVTDEGGATPHRSRVPQYDEESGRGLHILEALTTRWGVIPRTVGPGKSVWFEFREEPRPMRQISPMTDRWPFSTAAATPSHCLTIIWNPLPENGAL